VPCFPPAVGIDLGTTYSVIAIRTEAGMQVLRDEDDRALVPSAVYFAPDGSVLVGRAAQAFQHADPDHFIFNAKRFIGRSLDDAAVADQAPSHPFSIVPNATSSLSGAWFGSPVGRVMTPARVKAKRHPAVEMASFVAAKIAKAFESKTRAYAPGGGGIGLGGLEPAQDFSAPRRSVSPESVGAHVLRRLLDMAALRLGHRQISKAVMAVPAKFNAEQRRATVEAYKQAGLRVMRIIEEPTAAALAYGLDKKPNVDYILVYDFGGGTLDVSLLFVNKESVQVIATHGDDRLGGADFDQCVAASLSARLYKRGVDLSRPNPCGSVDHRARLQASALRVKGDSDEMGAAEAAEAARRGGVSSVPPCSPSTVRQAAERLKRDLSSFAEATAACVAPGASTGATLVTSEAEGGCGVVEVALTRVEFESECAVLFGRGLGPVEELLSEALMPRSEIDEVVLVGGSTRMPRVRADLKVFFGLEHLNQEIDPDLTIALGAASIVD